MPIYAAKPIAVETIEMSTIYRHKNVIIKSKSPFAEHAVLFAHGGIRETAKKYAMPVTVPDGKTLIYYAHHSQDTYTAVGWRLLLNQSTYDPGAESGAVKNILPVEFIQSRQWTFNYYLSPAEEIDSAIPNDGYDAIGLTARAYMPDIFEAVKIYRPNLKYIHCIHCRAVFESQGSARVYHVEPMKIGDFH